ncbi:MAG: helicase-associated domain-containing protein [Gemmataceae bacterium]
MPDPRLPLGLYSEPRLRQVADSLVKPRTKLDPEELIERCLQTLDNAAVIDRRIRDLPIGPRLVLTAIARSHQPVWKAGHLVTLAAAFGHPDGFIPVETLLRAGLIYPLNPVLPVPDFDAWFAAAGGLHAPCFVPSSILIRAASTALELAPLEGEAFGTPNHPSDSYDWPLRLAAVRQRVESDPVRMTRSGTLYKKDQTRFESDPVLNVPGLPDSGVLALFWALATGLLSRDGETLIVNPFPAAWEGSIPELIFELLAGYFAIESWDPLAGATAEDGNVSVGPTATLLILVLLAAIPADRSLSLTALADWLWEHHPAFPSIIPADHAKTRGQAWIDSLAKQIFEPLGLIERSEDRLRLTPLGQSALNGANPPAQPTPFPQTLLVQPNAEILVYRQGLTPTLLSTLTRFADWKVIGPACTLELTEQRVYRGLESGLTVAEMLHPLQKHGSRTVPPAVEDLLRRWGSKRERVSVYASATLVEFTTPAELDAAITRGVISIKLTDRIGLTADGRDPDYAALRLVGNRDYEARQQPCVKISDDGMVWTIDVALADLLLDAELVRLTDPIIAESPMPRRVQVNPAKIRSHIDRGMTRDELNQWFVVRTGHAMPPAIALFAFGPDSTSPSVARELVVRFDSSEIVDGLLQWPITAQLVKERLGPQTVAVAPEKLEELTMELGKIGISIRPDSI